MKTLGWAAIVYSVHDAYTFGALVLLIAGEIAVTFVSRHRPQRRTPLNFQKLKQRRLSRS
jgi:hypothetical protein